MRSLLTRILVVMPLIATVLWAPAVGASSECSFTVDGTTMALNADCTTDSTIWIPDGFTLDGAGYTITAVDPSGGHFVGAVVANEGSTAHVTDLTVQTSNLANVCDSGANRLRGIMFEGASGSIKHNHIVNINQGLSGCQEGNAIEIRNAPFDGTHPNTVFVEVSHNWIDDYQKTGVCANGDVDVALTNNYVGSADLKDHIAANSVQFGYGAMGVSNSNTILGNQWDQVSSPQWVATAVLVLYAGDVNINHNTVIGEGTDIGVLAMDSGTVNVMKNLVKRTFDAANDNIDEWGVGVYFYGNAGKSKLVRNTLSGWVLPYYGADLDKVNAFVP